MQIALAAVLVFSLVWFAVLRPKDEDVAATPVTPAETAPPRADAGGAAAESALGKTIETAKNGAANANAATKARERQTGEETTASATTPATAPKATTPRTAATAPESATPSTGEATTDEKAERTGVSAAQKRAAKVITKIQKDLAARRAVVVLVWAKKGKEDEIVHTRVTKYIDRRKGKVRVYTIPVSEVGRYDGLLSGLALGQIPSTIVIAPNNEAKVLGGLTSTERIDRLTSSATLTKPTADATAKRGATK
jgi:hypothetical protein